MTNRFRLGIYCVGDPHAFSGIPHNLLQAFRSLADVEVLLLAPDEGYRPSVVKRVLKRAERQLTGRHYLFEKEPARCKHFSRQLDRAIRGHSLDAVLLFGSENCAYSETSVPLYCYSDSLFGTRIDFYSDQIWTSLSPSAIADGLDVAQRSYDRLCRIFVSSQFAINRALSRFAFQRTREKCIVVGIGANLPAIPPAERVCAVSTGPIRFVWIGGDWTRKGGAFAVEAVKCLRELKVNAELDVVGGVDVGHAHSWVRPYGRLDYEQTEHFATLERIFKNAHAYLLPTEADLSPVAICEAFAFSRPVVASPVGGIPEMIEHGRTGLVLALDAPSLWAQHLFHAIAANTLVDMRCTCRHAFEARFNWPTICEKMLSVMQGLSPGGKQVSR